MSVMIPRNYPVFSSSELKLRFERAAQHHGDVDISYRARTTAEIAAAHDVAANLAQTRRGRSTAD